MCVPNHTADSNYFVAHLRDWTFDPEGAQIFGGSGAIGYNPQPEGGFMRIVSTYAPTRWDEEAYETIEERMKCTKASVEFAMSGDIEGSANVEYIMFYQSFDARDPHRSRAQYVALMRIIGKVRGKSGSFALIDNGTFEGGAANSKVSIIPESGTGELSKISGAGSYKADQTGCTLELEISF